MKKAVSIILSIVMLVSMVTAMPLAAHAAGSGKCGANVNFSYNSSTKKLTISGTGAMWNFIEDNPGWYDYRAEIRSVEVGTGVTKIGDYAFAYCENVTAVSFAGSVTNIGEYAFCYCDSLQSITLPAALTTIGQYAFENCSALKSITIPEGMRTITTYAFYNCTSLESVTFPYTIRTIEDYAFTDCNQITDVYYQGAEGDWKQIVIGEDNVYLKIATKHFEPTGRGACGTNVDYSFDSATGILTISGSGEMYNYDTNESPFSDNSDIAAVIIESGVTSIGGAAFWDCAGLVSITIPQSVTYIGAYATGLCPSLTDIYYAGSKAEWNSVENSGDLSSFSIHYHAGSVVTGSVGENVTYSLESGVLTISGTGDMYDYSYFYDNPSPFSEDESITAVIIESGVTNIGKYMFKECTGITSVSIGGDVAAIRDGAFTECSALKSVTIPDGVSVIEDSAFRSCTGLEEVTLADSVTDIENSAFDDCSALSAITIGSGMKHIRNYAFYNCNRLSDVYYTASKAQWSKISIDAENDPLTAATLHCAETTATGKCGENVNYTWDMEAETVVISGTGDMYDYNDTDNKSPFYYYGFIKTVTVESGVTSIGDYAFCGCADLESVALADSVEKIGKDAFELCKKLTGVTFGSGLTSIGKEAFKLCSALESVDIPEGVTAVPERAFEFCEALKTVSLPLTVSNIGYRAFFNCSALADVYYAGSKADWKAISIDSGNYPLTAALRHYAIHDVSGTCGAQLTWSFDFETNIFIISGTGAMDNFTSTSMPWYAFKDEIKTVIVENGVTTIGENAFWNCKAIESVTLGDTLESIGKYAFSGCESLESIHLPNSLTSIGVQAFGNCESLESIAIPSGVTSLATSTFASCGALKTVTLPTTLTKIGAAAFSRCYNLQTVGYAGTQENWNAVEILDSNDPLLAVKPQTGDIIRTGTCGENVTYILNETTGLLTISGTGAMYDYDMMENPSPFNNNQKIKEIVVESGVTNIGDDAFTQLTKLEKVSLPSTVTSLGKDAFAFCFLLADINIPESVQSIGKEAFSACYALTSITIPKGVKTIGKSTFWYCKALQSVTLPKSLESVSDNAFVYCSALTDVFYEGTASEWSAITISSTGNDPLLSATKHFGATDFAAIRYKVPAFAGTNTTLTFKSDSMTLTVSAADGNFNKDNVQGGVYRVYAKQKNCLTIYLGEYDTASGAVTNTGALILPLGDVNGDNVIDMADTSRLLSAANYGKHNANMDLTGDGMITVADISTALLAENYGMSSVKVV
ncbi:MAG: hypothetical protein E7517_03365 [Ruminococcaceae bacterium]|nr:hypothetical protein [Oscillospiraceae bacterium]